MRLRPLRQSPKIRPSSPLTPSRNFPMTLPAISKAFLRRRSPRARMRIANRQSPLLRKSQNRTRLAACYRCNAGWRHAEGNGAYFRRTFRYPRPLTGSHLSADRHSKQKGRGNKSVPFVILVLFIGRLAEAPGATLRLIRRGRLFTTLVTFLRLDGQGRYRSCVEALEANRLTRFFTVTVSAVINPLKGRVDLGDQLALAVTGAKFDRPVSFRRCPIG